MFRDFKVLITTQFERMKKYPLFQVTHNPEAVWETYLRSFPDGTNPKFRERTEHDCQCCKKFIRDVGAVVAIIDGKVESIWDVPADGCYAPVAKALSTLIKSSRIANVYMHFEGTVGTDKNYQSIPAVPLSDTGVQLLTWEHFHVKLPQSAVAKNSDIPSKLGELRTTREMLEKSLRDISMESIDTVLDLIAQGSLYRGEEHVFAITAFRDLKKEFDKIGDEFSEDIFCWTHFSKPPKSVSCIKNTVIGTLLVALSEGVDLEFAVKGFESKVAPSNYKRPVALVTKGMIEGAKKTVNELGLASALERRYANIQDITVNNILFANRTAKKVLSGDIFDSMSQSEKVDIKKFSKVEEVSIDAFINNILPTAESIELLLENKHEANLVSLIAPLHNDSKELFKWPNRFSWSYKGEMADSMKEKVKRAGGSVEGDVCCRLAWDYKDDLDAHMHEPDGGHIFFRFMRTLSECGGMLDVDANGIDGQKEEPVENIFYKDSGRMRLGRYEFEVNNYNRRSDGVGFEAEVEVNGVITSFNYDKVVRNGETIKIATIVKSTNGIEVISHLPSSQSVRNLWGINTQSFHNASVVMLSPNHWDDKAVGNKHYLFMLEGCLNDGKARGFFNEFLTEDLSKHRKVLEIAGSKMKTDESQNQLSGLGFSSTQRNSILCRVGGSFSRVIKINF